jgi:hypothetical protein
MRKEEYPGGYLPVSRALHRGDEAIVPQRPVLEG